MSRPDVLLINPSALTQIYQDLSKRLVAVEPPIWLGLIANYLRNKGYDVAVLDMEGEGLAVAEACARSSAINARLTAIIVYGQQPSASTQNMWGAHLLCDAVKEAEPDRRIVLVGGHVAALPQRTLTEEKADFVAAGEGPLTLHGLLQSDMSRHDHLAKVPGLWWRDSDGGIRHNPPAPLIPSDHLEQDLPGVAYDLLPMQNYRAHNWHCFDHINERQPYASIYTSLGCPFHCSFCCINAPFGGSGFRYWDPEFTARQFDLLAEKYGVRNVKIADEMFVLKPSHFLKLCELLKDRGHGFNIWAYARVDTVKPQYLKALKDAGVNWLVLGIESKSRFVRDGVEKGRFAEEAIPEVVRRIKDAGINVLGNFIFGLPDDDLHTMQETLDLAMELNCEFANFYSAMAYPGSDLYRLALENKWTLPETWLGYSQHAYETLPLPTRKLSAGDVLAFRDQAWQTYFTNPTYHQFVKAHFGQETLDHVIAMTRHSLKRKYRTEA